MDQRAASLLQVALFALPWSLRRRALSRLLGYEIHPTARIGLSLVLADRVHLGAHSVIGHLNLARGLHEIVLGEHASIGHINWIAGAPKADQRYYAAQPERAPSLIVGRHAAVTHRHLIDCTDRVHIGDFATLAGWRSQILTHAIDMALGVQTAGPVSIGEYCFVGTGVIVLKGASLPPRCVLAAGAVLVDAPSQTDAVYGGVPARIISSLDGTGKYFTRTTGHVF